MIRQINQYSLRQLHFTIIVLFIVISSTTSLVTQDCHYSCKKCIQPFYDRCVQCHEGSTYEQLINNLTRQGQNFRYLKYGLCQGSLILPINPLGIIALILCILTYWLKLYQKKHSNIILLTSWIQTLSMLSFISLPFQQPLSFLLQSFTFFMPITTLSKLYKLNQKTDQLIEDHQYRLKHFLMTDKPQKNVIVLGPIICILIVYVGLIPLFLHFRKRICGEDKCRRWSERILKKIQGLFYILFFFIIQQTYLILFVSLKKDLSNLAIVFTVLFVLATIFMIINYAIKPIPQFPNKKILFLHIFEKITLPLMIVSPTNVYLVMVPSISFVLRLIEAKMNDKDYNLKTAEKKMYFGYLICVAVIIFLMGTFLVVEKTAESQMASKVVGILVSLVIIVLYGASLGEQGFEIWTDYRKKQQQEINARNTLIREQVTTLALSTHMNHELSRNNTIEDIKIQIKETKRQFQSQMPSKYEVSNTEYQEDIFHEDSTKRLRKESTNKKAKIQSVEPATIPQVQSSQTYSNQPQDVTSIQNNYEKTLSPKIQSDSPTKPKNNNIQQKIEAQAQDFSQQMNQSHWKESIRNEFSENQSGQKLKKRKRKPKQTPVFDQKQILQAQLKTLQQNQIQLKKQKADQNSSEN